MVEVIWTHEVRDDVEEIAHRIARDLRTLRASRRRKNNTTLTNFTGSSPCRANGARVQRTRHTRTVYLQLSNDLSRGANVHTTISRYPWQTIARID